MIKNKRDNRSKDEDVSAINQGGENIRRKNAPLFSFINCHN